MNKDKNHFLILFIGLNEEDIFSSKDIEHKDFYKRTPVF